MTNHLRIALRGLQGVIRDNVPLAPLTHIRIGGSCAHLVEPFNEEDIGMVVRACAELDLPLHVLGGGSNLVVADQGVPGVVMSLGSLNRVVRDDNRLTAGAGVSLATLLRGARELGLAGLEVLTGIPAVVGGAVAMNAGTREGEIFDYLVSLTVVDAAGEIRVLGRDRMAPGYRNGGLDGRITVHATFELREDSPKAIFARFESYLKFRNTTQPVSERSVGCVFRNPNGESAGQLIERAGCKLIRRGGISVSAKHGNYFVNDGSGTCADFLGLMDEVRDRVGAEFGIELQLEVKLWGG